MATVFENRPAPVYTPPEEEAALHNARIKERYEQLRNAEATQLAESISEAERAPYAATRASAPALAPERPERTASYPAAPATEGAPRTAEYVHTKVNSPLFTPETLDRTIRREDYDFAPSETPDVSAADLLAASVQTAGGAAVAEMPVTAVNVGVREESYGFSRFAKMVMAAFAALVIVMLTVICINTQVISSKSAQLRRLETERQALVEENAALEGRIEEAKSPEKILEYAQEHGMIFDDK